MHYFGTQITTQYYNDFIIHMKNSLLNIIDDITANIPSGEILLKLEYLRSSIFKRVPGYVIYRPNESKIKKIYDTILSIIDNITAGVGLGIARMRSIYLTKELEKN